MSDGLSGVGRGRGPSGGAQGVGGRVTRSTPARAAAAPRQDLAPPDPQQRHYVHSEGRRFDLSAPRGTYLNILI